MESPNPHAGVTLLVRRAKAGDRRAFDELVRRYRERIYALALHITGNKSEADDVTQDVFLRAYRVLESFEGRSQFFTWLYRMAINHSLNACRKRKRRSERVLDDTRVERAVAVDAPGSPGRAAELRQTYARLLTALDQLSPEMRTSVVLVIMQGLSQAEAAVVQQCSVGTIAWRIHEARKRMRRALDITNENGVQHAPEPSSELTDLLSQWGWPVLTPF